MALADEFVSGQGLGPVADVRPARAGLDQEIARRNRDFMRQVRMQQQQSQVLALAQLAALFGRLRGGRQAREVDRLAEAAGREPEPSELDLLFDPQARPTARGAALGAARGPRGDDEARQLELLFGRPATVTSAGRPPLEHQLADYLMLQNRRGRGLRPLAPEEP